MRRTLVFVSFSVIVAGCGPLVLNEAEQLESVDARDSTQVLVTIAQTAPSRALGLVGAPGQSYQRRRGYGPAPAVDRELDRLAREHRLRRVRGWHIAEVGVYCEVLEVPANVDVDRIIAALLADPAIDVAQRMNVFDTLGSRYNDPYVELQTSVSALGIESAHRFATGKGITVAVIDSQIDTSHPDLRRSIRHVRDLVDNGLTSTPEVHGTAVAGIIASAADNTEGIVGIAPDASIAALRACWSVDSRSSAARCTSFSIAQALEIALELNTRIINLSLTGPQDPLLTQLIDEALRRGSIVVAAVAAPEDTDRNFPASHPGVIVAAPVAGAEQVSHRLRLSAPGEEILTTAPGAEYGFFTGSSLSAAHVSGVLALLLERNPGMNAADLHNLLARTADAANPTHQINACRAVTHLLASGECPDDAQRRPMANEVQSRK